MNIGLRRIAIACSVAAALAAGCAQQEQRTLQSLQQPINCRTAEGDLRALQGEKTHTVQQIASGVAAITPAGFVLGAITGTEGTKVQVASGEYNTMIDNRIAAIKATCHVG